MFQHILGQPFRIPEIPPVLPEDPLKQTAKCRLKLQVCERILMFFSSLLVNAVHENFGKFINLIFFKSLKAQFTIKVLQNFSLYNFVITKA